MEIRTIPMAEASRDQLYAYATTVLGLDVHTGTGEEKIRAAIAAANPDAKTIEIMAPAVAGPAEVAAPAPPEAAAPLGPPAAAPAAPPAPPEVQSKSDTVIVFINTSEASDGAQDVFLACNGRGMLVPRGEWCEIPRRHFNALKDAVEERYEPLEGGGIPTKPRLIQRYPFQVWQGPGEPPEGVRRPQAQRQPTVAGAAA